MNIQIITNKNNVTIQAKTNIKKIIAQCQFTVSTNLASLIYNDCFTPMGHRAAYVLNKAL
jgi:hypothetical protein